MVKKIKKLDINLFPESKTEYEKEKTEYIANYKRYVASTRKYHYGGLFSSGYYTGEDGKYVADPVLAEAKWNEEYPKGFDDWRKNRQKLTSYGEQRVVDKINELVKTVNLLIKVKTNQPNNVKIK